MTFGDRLGRPSEARQRAALVDARGGAGDARVEVSVRTVEATSPLIPCHGRLAEATLRISPGSTITTSMPKPRTSKRRASEIASTAYFVAW